MWSLQARMYLLLAALFALIYMVVTVIGTGLGITNFYFYLVVSVGMMFLQYLIGPKMVEWSMRVRYVEESEAPDLHRMVAELARQAGIPKPRVGISQLQIPNAFAFGRGPSDGRMCVTSGVLQLLDKDELRAVIGHEITHLKSRDVLTITILSVIPMVLYRIAWGLMWYGGGRRRERGGPSLAVVGMLSFFFYFITNLLVLYASRLREYFADEGSVRLGNRPEHLASALYKLVYGSARVDKESLKEVEGVKAFFLNDPSQARNDIMELSQVDLDRSGTISSMELKQIQTQTLRLGFADRLMEMVSTHPNMLKRIKQLSQYDMTG